MGQTKLAVLRGDRISKGFFTRKIMSGWAAKKKSSYFNSYFKIIFANEIGHKA